jgi:hypothetical protein
MKLNIHRANIHFPLVAAAAAVVLSLGVPLRAQSPECATVSAATSKVYDKPVHIFMTDSAQTDARLHAGRPTVSEEILTGSATYVMVRGRWRKSPIDIAEMRKRKDASTTDKATCSHLRDESVNGEPAGVWRMHSVSEVGTSDTDVWISRRSGLLLKSDIHQDVGGAFGKSHIVNRYDYTNVRPPAGVP